MTIQEIKQKMSDLELSQSKVCKDLGITNGDLSNYLSLKKPIPASRIVTFKLYFEKLENNLKINA